MAIKDELVQRVVNFLRDAKEKNRILDDIETKTEQIVILLDDVLESFNKTPPTTNFKFEELPKEMLRDLVVIEVLKSAGIWYTRNSIAYSSGGVTIQDYEGKGPAYASWCSSLMAKAESTKRSFKIKANVEGMIFDC